MTKGPLDRRLVRLETAAGVGLVLPVIFVCFVASDGTEPPSDTAAVNGKVWRREPDETEEAFRSLVAAEAKPFRPGCGTVMFLE